MITDYGTHPLQNAAIAANALRRAVRELSNNESINDVVGLSLAANTLDAVADALDRQWWATRPTLEEDNEPARDELRNHIRKLKQGG